jgi:predicted amidohydrolase YtcJ
VAYAPNAESAPATLYAGGVLLTLDPVTPRAEALATVGGRILAVGTEDECDAALRAAAVRDVERVELGGRALLPGFIDTHLHPIAMVYFDLNADLRGVRSIAEVQDAVRTAAQRGGPDDWVVGLQLEDEALAERRLPTRHELDAACGERPVVLMEHDGHSAVGNSRALAAAGLDASTPDPVDGRIARDSDGAPAGACFESAARRLVGVVPSPSLERMRETARGTFARLSACGITSAGVILQTDEEGPGGAAGSLESVAMQLLLDAAPFAPYSILVGRTVDAALALRATALHEPAAGRRVGGFKIFADGTFGSCTACMREPFSDRPGERGFMTLADDEILERMRTADAAGLQICVHAIGDAAVERCVALFERLLGGTPPRDHRHRIEHASLIPPEVIPRIARLGLCVSTQPLFIHSEKGWLHRRLGTERARHAYPLRSLVDAGVVVGGASDAPVESTDVVHALACAVTREGFEPEQGLTPLEALRLFTSHAAHLQFEEAEKGRLAPGMRADLVIASASPLAVRPDRIGDVRVLRTVVAGRTVFDAEGGFA